MLRVITPKKELIEISAIRPIAEKSVSFNKQNKNMYAKPIDANSSEVTGLLVITSKLNHAVEVNYARLRGFYVGNLPHNLIDTIISKVATDGCFDFSKMEYQPMAHALDKYVIDGGNSKPYLVIDDEFRGLVNLLKLSDEYTDYLKDDTFWDDDFGSELLTTP